jgi:iduronate 2-sulfatase
VAIYETIVPPIFSANTRLRTRKLAPPHGTPPPTCNHARAMKSHRSDGFSILTIQTSASSAGSRNHESTFKFTHRRRSFRNCSRKSSLQVGGIQTLLRTFFRVFRARRRYENRMPIRRLINSVFAFVIFAATCSHAAKKPNVLLICIDDLRPELASFGKSYIKSPNIDKLAATGRPFFRHYVQAPTCGASRYALLTGLYGGPSNNALFTRAAELKKKPGSLPPTMPAWFRTHGYTTVSVGKVSHHPGGRGGRDWNDNAQPEMPNSWDRHLLPAGDWHHPRGSMHGLAHGEIRVKAGEMDVHQSVAGPDSIYPDGLITDEALNQMDQFAAEPDQPFFLAVGIIRPHLPFGAPAKYMEHYRDVKLPKISHPGKPAGKTTWHRSGEFMKYNRWQRNPNDDAAFAIEVRKHYAACVTYADALVGKVMKKLEAIGAKDDTIVVLWGDHGWHLGEHSIWGKHALFEESLHSPLIIRYPGIPSGGKSTRAMVETLDIFPTLCQLAGVPKPKFADGISLLPILKNPEAVGHSAFGYFRNARTIRTQTHRLIAHQTGHVELYDHRSKEKETKNIAEENPQLVKRLIAQIDRKLGAKK